HRGFAAMPIVEHARKRRGRFRHSLNYCPLERCHFIHGVKLRRWLHKAQKTFSPVCQRSALSWVRVRIARIFWKNSRRWIRSRKFFKNKDFPKSFNGACLTKPKSPPSPPTIGS